MLPLPLFGLIGLLATIMCVFFALILFGRRDQSRAWRRGAASSGYPQSSRGKIGLGNDDDVPLTARKVSLRICAECRELILIEATSCKYCGTVPIGTTPPVTGEVALRLNRKR